MDDRISVRAAFEAALRPGAPAADLDRIVPAHFRDLRAFREGEDLILLAGETHRLLVRRIGPDRYLTGDVASASGSTNLLDQGGEAEHDLDGLIDRIAAFAAL